MYSAEPKLPRSRKRLDHVAQALARRQEGQSYGEIAEALGVSRSTVASYLTDPDGSKARARKARYRGVCSSCGAPTNRGRRARSSDDFVCAACDDEARRYWTPERVVAALRAWHQHTGQWPTSYDWTTARATKDRRLSSKSPKTREHAQRIEALLEVGNYPDPARVKRVFGTMAAAIARASSPED